MCLTNEGKKLMPHIHELTRVMESIREAARQDAEPGGELRVATGETFTGVQNAAGFTTFCCERRMSDCRYSR